MKPTHLATIGILLLLGAGISASQSAAHFSAQFHSAGPISLTGGVKLMLANPALHLQPARGDRESLGMELRADHVRVTTVYREAVLTRSPVGGVEVARVWLPGDRTEEFTATEAAISILSARNGAHVLVYPTGESTRFDLTLTASALMADITHATHEKIIHAADRDSSGTGTGRQSQARFEYTYPGEAFKVEHAFEPSAAQGDFSVYFWDTDFVVTDTSGAPHRFRTGIYEERAPDGVTSRQRIEYAIVQVTGSSARLESTSPVSAYARDLTLDLDGRAILHAVTGSFEIDGRRYVANNEPKVTFDGQFTLMPRFEGTAGEGGTRLLQQHEGGMQATLQGHVASVSLPPIAKEGGNAIPVAAIATGAVAIATVGGLALGLVKAGGVSALTARVAHRRARRAKDAPAQDPDLLMATNLLVRDRHAEAAGFFGRYLKRHANDASALTAQGTCYLQTGDVARALAAFLKAAALAPRDESVNYMVAHAAARSGKPEQALAWLARTRDIAPEVAMRSREDHAFESLWTDTRYREIFFPTHQAEAKSGSDDTGMYH